MEALIAIVIGTLVASGIYLLLRARTFPVVLGLALLSYAVNLFLLATGRFGNVAPSIVPPGPIDPAAYADPLPQALVLTAIVIGFAMTAFVVILSVRAYMEMGSDHVDGEPDDTHDVISLASAKPLSDVSPDVPSEPRGDA